MRLAWMLSSFLLISSSSSSLLTDPPPLLLSSLLLLLRCTLTPPPFPYPSVPPILQCRLCCWREGGGGGAERALQTRMHAAQRCAQRAYAPTRHLLAPLIAHCFTVPASQPLQRGVASALTAGLERWLVASPPDRPLRAPTGQHHDDAPHAPPGAGGRAPGPRAAVGALRAAARVHRVPLVATCRGACWCAAAAAAAGAGAGAAPRDCAAA